MSSTPKQNNLILNSFKKELEIEKDSPKNKPYSLLKPSILFYRITFLTISFVYLVFACILFSKSLTWTCSLIFGSTLAVKTVLIITCAAVSLTSLYFGLLISSEKESVKLTIRHAKKKLKRLYYHKLGAFSPKRLFPNEEQRKTSYLLEKQLNYALEKLHHLQLECLHLIDRIVKSKTLEMEEKEELFNQAIIELRTKTESLLEAFEKKGLS